MNERPDFYLSAPGESEDFAHPRACWSRGRLTDGIRDEFMLIEIRPPLSGQKYGLGGKNISFLLISPKFEGMSLFPIKKWPFPVYVARLLDDSALTTRAFKSEQVELITWGALYESLEEAERRM